MHVLTLRYDSNLGRIDERPLTAFLGSRQLISLREHFFSIGELPHLACVVTYEAPNPIPAVNAEPTAPRTTTTATNGRPAQSPRVDPNTMSAADRVLFDAFREWRARRADAEGVSRFLVLTNRQLEAIAIERPTSLHALAQIPGFGKSKLDRYGEAVLAILANRQPVVPANNGAAQPTACSVVADAPGGAT